MARAARDPFAAMIGSIARTDRGNMLPSSWRCWGQTSCREEATMTGLDSIFGGNSTFSRLLPLFILLIVFLFIEWWF